MTLSLSSRISLRFHISHYRVLNRLTKLTARAKKEKNVRSHCGTQVRIPCMYKLPRLLLFLLRRKVFFVVAANLELGGKLEALCQVYNKSYFSRKHLFSKNKREDKPLKSRRCILQNKRNLPVPHINCIIFLASAFCITMLHCKPEAVLIERFL
jgi:hypothetical protein